jgi:hypothetical protein
MALGGIVELGETEPVGCETIKIGCFNFTAITTDVREAEIIDHDDHNVGPF